MFVVFCMDYNNEPVGYEVTTLTEALEKSKEFRGYGWKFVTIASENPNCTSLPGVDSVKDMILPNGAEYGYVKRRYK